ncbi:ABC transporter permease [Sinomicrobium sp. M5D2P9]
MIKNYFKIAWRNMLRNKTFSTINILGLSIGLSCFLLLTLYIKDELNYDRHHENADRIYRVSREFLSQDGSTSLHLAQVAPPYGPLIQEDFSEVEQVVRTLEVSAVVKYGESTFKEKNIFFAEDGFLDMFTFHVEQGDPRTALKDPFHILFSKPMAEKYFGNENPVGKLVRLNNEATFTVSGVFDPMPSQSSFHPDFLVSFTTLRDEQVYGEENLRSNWGNNAFSTYLLLPENYDPQKIVDIFPGFQDKHIGENTSEYSILHLMKLADIHLYSHTDSEIEPTSDIRYVYFFSVIALFILVIACINYMNLTTAKSAKRAKEVGMRKVAGANRGQLIRQFLGESLFYTGIALLISVALVALTIPLLNDISGKNLVFWNLLTLTFIGILLAVALFTTLVSGSYPAFFLTAFQPVKVLKGKIATHVKKGKLQQVLVTVQFAIAVLLIICTIVVYSQMRHVQNYKLGYSKEQIVLLPAMDDSGNYESVRQQLKQNSGIVEMSQSSRVPTGRLLDSQGAYVIQGGHSVSTDVIIKNLSVDEYFIPAYEIKMAAGRNFSREHSTDRANGFILNETAARTLGWNDPADAVGKEFGYGSTRGQIIGVTEDYHFESLHQQVAPLVMYMDTTNFNRWSVRLAGGDIKSSLNHLEKAWNTHFPEQPFTYEFLDSRFGALYSQERTQQVLYGIFAGIAIFISCLGLFGLSMFLTELRIKEIGIRKVLGASVTGIVRLLSKDFLKLVVIAILIASPVAWWIMNSWLEGFAYRIHLQWWMFALAGLAAIVIALVTVSGQSVKAAVTNPSKSLRTE